MRNLIASWPHLQDVSMTEFRERYLKPYYLPATFIATALTLGVRTASENFLVESEPLSYIGCCISTGALCTALAWVVFDFTEDPKPPAGR